MILYIIIILLKVLRITGNLYVVFVQKFSNEDNELIFMCILIMEFIYDMRARKFDKSKVNEIV